MQISNLIAPLVLTVVIECMTAIIMGYRGKYLYITLVLVNVITNPLLNYIVSVVSLLWPVGSRYLIIPLELAVVLTEWKLLSYAFPEKQKSFLTLSVLMNAVSYLTGLLITFLLAK